MAEAVVRNQTQQAPNAKPVRKTRQYRAPKFLPLWALIGVVIAVALIGSYPYYGSNAYVLSLLGKFLCFGLFALSIDLIWGFTGILSLGRRSTSASAPTSSRLSLKINYAMDHQRAMAANFPTSWNGTV